MANKIAIAGLASILVVACVVAAAVTVSKKNSSDSSSDISTSSKSVKAMCEPTDYKEACENSLASAKNTTDPKELIKVAFESTITDIKNAIKNTDLIKEAAKDPRTKEALQTCEGLLDVSIDDLRRSFDKVGSFDINKIEDYTDDLKTWISASITYQETCLDAFSNTSGDTGEKMKKLLKTAGELTSNGLAMITSFGEMLTNLHIPGINRRLLTTDNDYSSFVEAGSRRLLQVSNVKPNAVFGHGQSNPTFLIEVHSGTLTKKYVLRKKAHGNLLASAHAVEREYEDVPPERRMVIYRVVAQALVVLHFVMSIQLVLVTMGSGLTIGRLGPGRLHHCMRLIGAADRGMQMMVQRALQRKAFGKLIAQHGSFLSDVARCRIDLEKTRLLVLEVADQLDRLGNKKARGTIAMANVAAPNMALKVLDTAMQVHSGAGLSIDTVLAHLWALTRGVKNRRWS
ncbi:hypothetical protein K7X08_030447 [Anisodus acutangulus]|uniref:Pectinesterase inhibitor domain-containing protein n=1 Tax=Anisodus acutangulus TaxID=402998 RepID=A0A9Q1L3P7_9SOLA|nr:hypothetical protein K7X08_030447 [Anisodus acutangulus]